MFAFALLSAVAGAGSDVVVVGTEPAPAPTRRYVVAFRTAAVFVEVDAEEFARAQEILTPFLQPAVAGDADEYAKAAQSVDGQNYSFEGARAAGLFEADGNGDPMPGVEVFQAD